MPSGQFIAQVYDAFSRGAELYRKNRFAEALPFLVAASKRGFKCAQASAADIYLHGRGGVPVDLEAGIGWLGAAAEPRTAHSIVEFYEESRALLPARYTPEQPFGARGRRRMKRGDPRVPIPDLTTGHG